MSGALIRPGMNRRGEFQIPMRGNEVEGDTGEVRVRLVPNPHEG